MEQYVKSISLRAEFFIVVLVAFGYFMLTSVMGVFVSGKGAHITEDHLQFLLIYESVVILVLWGFLSLRGWKMQQVGLVPTLKDIPVGCGLFLVVYLAYIVTWAVSSHIVAGVEHKASGLISPGLGMTTVIAVSVLNPIFEEVFVCGYVITALEKSRGMSFAVNVSVAIRLAYHLYQGSMGVLFIVPLGIVFAYWFGKTRRLWPVIIAHALFDLWGLIAYVQM